MMKSHSHSKAKGGNKVNMQQAIFELKHRVVLALNKLTDRDTYHIGAEELEKTAQGLTPDGVVPFLSCIIETDSEQKSSVRKECIRVMGTLAKFHGALLGPHLGKMVGSIVKRLKDPDSIVREACVETVGVLSSHISICGGGVSVSGGGPFVALVKPLFEALGEQNRQVQSGSALCLARVIDNANAPSMSILMRILTRIIKLLKNQHFMAKPALIELIRSIIQAGGASTESALSTAVTSIQEALKSSDWTTRKAASVALAGIAASGGSLLGSLKTSCIRSLELCRFDKVKPVRDSILLALQYWRSLPCSDSPDPSEAESSTKENFCGGDHADLTSASDGGWKDISLKKVGSLSAVSGNPNRSIKKRAPLTVRKTCPNYEQNPNHPKRNDWHTEITLPKALNASIADTHNEKSEGCCVTKTFERTKDATRAQGIRYDCEIPMDDKLECSTMSDFVPGSFETKCMTVGHGYIEEVDSVKPLEMNYGSAAEEIVTKDNICPLRMQERKSLDSTVTELSSLSLNGCCSRTANDLAFIRKQLLEIESKQSDLLDLLQVFMGSSIDRLSMLQSKVVGLEHVIDKIAGDVAHYGSYSSMANPKILKKNHSVSSSPRFSTYSPRPSVDSSYRQPSLSSLKGRDLWEESAFTNRKSCTSVKTSGELWTDPTLNIIRNPIAKGIQKSLGRVQSTGSRQSRKAEDVLSASTCHVNVKQNTSETMNSFPKHVEDFLSAGNIEAAFVEALCSNDDIVLVELMDRTGPVLERLSHETVSEILSTIAALFLDQRFLDSIIPWLQQVVDLSTTFEPIYLVQSAKERKEFLRAIQQTAAMEFSDPADRRSVRQLALKLRQVWGKCS